MAEASAGKLDHDNGKMDSDNEMEYKTNENEWKSPSKKNSSKRKYSHNRNNSLSSQDSDVDFFNTRRSNPDLALSNRYELLAPVQLTPPDFENDPELKNLLKEISEEETKLGPNFKPNDRPIPNTFLPSKNTGTKPKIKFQKTSEFSNGDDRSRPNPMANLGLPEYATSVYMTSTKEGFSLSKNLSSFAIRKIVDNICGTVKTVKPCRSGSLLIETIKHSQVKEIFKTKTIHSGNNEIIPVKVELASDYDTVQGLVFAPGLFNCNEENIVQELASQRAIKCQRMTKGKEKTPTRLLKLTFGGKKLPEKIFCGYQAYSVDLYIPRPLRCFRCQRFGHGVRNCNSHIKCGKCAKDHNTSECVSEVAVCSNCSGQHEASSTHCPTFKKENEINTIRHQNGISYKDAKIQYEANVPTLPSSYSYANATNDSTGHKNRSHTRQTEENMNNTITKLNDTMENILKVLQTQTVLLNQITNKKSEKLINNEQIFKDDTSAAPVANATAAQEHSRIKPDAKVIGKPPMTLKITYPRNYTSKIMTAKAANNANTKNIGTSKVKGTEIRSSFLKH